MQFKLGELFCGPGGLGYGAQLAKVRAKDEAWDVRHEWANDYDSDSCSTYRRNICPNDPESVICLPVQNLVIEKLGKINALAFGFPCNDFSMVGERKGFNGKYGPLYTYGVNILNQFSPDWFIAENVSGLENANNGNAFSKILADLRGAGCGYHLAAHLYKFEEYGIPQKRHRIIIVGISNRYDFEFKIPAPTTLNRPITAKEALTKPPIPLKAENQELTRQSPTVIERLNYLPPGENAWFHGLPEHLRLNVKGARLSQIYKRLRPDEPAYTVTGSGGGGTHVYHWKEPRALTNRERARLQTFPDHFVFEGSKESARKQIGMAVPPIAAKLIVEAILKTFAGTAYSSIDAEWPEKNVRLHEDPTIISRSFPQSVESCPVLRM